MRSTHRKENDMSTKNLKDSKTVENLREPLTPS